jgi:hypothetical protein
LKPEQERPTLLDNIDLLTLPHRTKVIQDGPIGSGLAGQQTVTVTLPPLLQQLDDAIRGTIGIGGSGSLASQRSMLDGDALFRFAKISSTIKEWARMVGATITADDAGKTLRAWYVRYTATIHELESERFYEKETAGWVASINAKFNQPRIHDLPDPCPLCGASSWFNPSDGQEYLRPLIVEYRETGPNLIQEAKAICRACATVWGVRELAYAIEGKEEEIA